MAEQIKKRKSWLKRILISLLILALIVASVYWYVATEKFADTKERKPAFTVNALDFIREFQQNDSAANAKYTDQIITVNGRVSEMEAADTTVNIKFIDTTTGSYAIFAFQQQHLAEAKAIKAGDSISVKGSCSGSIYSEILDATAINFKRSTLNKL
jgi:uncharacterized membrane protein